MITPLIRIGILISLILGSGIVGIQTVRAETIVSQIFPGPVVYFDTSVKTKYVFSEGDFYSGTNPSAAQVWETTGLSTTVFDSYDYYEFTTDSGIAFGDYSYISTQAEQYRSMDKNVGTRLG